MRRHALALCGALVLSVGCPATQQRRLAPAASAPVARIVEQHDFEHGQVSIWRIDGQPVRERNFWRRVDLELDVAPGKHDVECSFTSARMRSTQNAILSFDAAPGQRYVVHARHVKRGFWNELGKSFQSTVWPAKTSWVAWIEDSSGNVVAGIRPSKQGTFRTELAEDARPPATPAGGPP